ncbi:MAG: D-specific alpha-keto acid dehydrogenase, partial [Actinomycetota bacterium]|nr:D-specific alpha-keto acid dehydrogenase [Actinomycetota bacterium]
MAYRSPAQTDSDRTGPAAAPHAVATTVEIAVYGCGEDEADLFRGLAPGFGVTARISAAAVSDANVDLAIGKRCISVSHKTRIANSTLRLLSEAGVRYISTRSAGHNHIDVDFARSVGIDVEGVAYSSDGVADYTLMLMLMALRGARSIITRAERHDFRLNAARGKELGDLTVGVIGTGRIGASVIERLRGFGCRVLAYDRNPVTSAEYVDLDELLRRSDIVTLHAPLTPETNHLLSRDRIDQLKQGAFVINTGRGALVDTDALVSALENGRLGGAALDVVEGEDGIFYVDRRPQPIDDERFLRLQRLPNVIITPHTAYYTEHALHDTVTNTILNCLEFE